MGAALAVAFLTAGCLEGAGDGADPPSAERRLRPPEEEPAPTPAPAAAPAPAPAPDPAPASAPAPTPAAAPAPPEEVRARQIIGGRLVADVIFASEVKAKSGSIQSAHEDQTERRWQLQIGGLDLHLDTPELRAKVVYAEKVDVQTLEATEVYARSIDLGGGKGGAGKGGEKN